MKKIFLLIAPFALMIALSSCVDMLDTAPSNQIASGNMWTTEALCDAGVNGLYKNFYSTDNQWDHRQLSSGSYTGIMKQDVQGLEFQSMYTENGMTVLHTASKNAGDKCVWYEWQWCYTGIHRINDALENLHKGGLSTAKYERYMCEAKFLRAWYYTRLNKFYQGVPIYLETISNEECTKTQSTSTEVWEVVINDLNDCIECDNFPNNTLTTNYGRPSKGAAYALRGEAYMWLAWENNESTTYYQLAANDLEKVSECGYGLWAGKYIDFFHYNNEKDHEMIFPLQYTNENGFCDDLQNLEGARDFYFGLCWMRPSADFVDYYQNSDGTTFDYTSRIPEWNDAVFLNNCDLREVFYMRDSILLDDNDKCVVGGWTGWSATEAGKIDEEIAVIGLDVFKKYYDPYGNEDRIRSVYNNRDPRLKVSILVPYDPVTVYYYSRNNNENQENKELRWPYLRNDYISGHDIYISENYGYTYLWKKMMFLLKGEMAERAGDRYELDWPLIRYTDVYLHLAECYVKLGRLSEAVGIVNEIRARAEMPSISVGTADEVMEAVRYERRVELCFEGVDYFDEVRWGTYKQTKFQGKDVHGFTTFWGKWSGTARTFYWSDYLYPWPAPKTEVEKNPNLVRGQGWSY